PRRRSPPATATDRALRPAAIRYRCFLQDHTSRACPWSPALVVAGTSAGPGSGAEPAGQIVGAVLGQGAAGPVVAHGGLRPGVPGKELRAAHVAVGALQV